MKQIIFSLALLLGISAASYSQNNYSNYDGKKWEQLKGSGILAKLNPAIVAFTAIELNNLNVKIKVETGASEFSMYVSIDDNLKDFFKWQQDGSILKMSFDFSGGKYPRWLSGNNTVITIKAPAIEKMVNHGNSELEISLQNQEAFTLSSNGNPDITLTGKIAELNILSTGNADIKAGQLIAEKITLSSNGNADIEVKTKELIEKEIQGNNEINNLYYVSNKVQQTDNDGLDNEKTALISFKIKNNNALPKKITLVSYRPDRVGNGTNSFTLITLGIKNLRFPVGTKIYLASSEQVNTVMSGAKISDQVPFLIVKAEDDGKIFQIK
jgi:hypothetical protein